MERIGSMAVSAEQFIVLVLSISCGVLGGFLLAHRGGRMMRGGLLYRLSVGLAAVGIALSLSAGCRILVAATLPPAPFELDGRRSREDRRSLARADPPFDHGRGRRRGEGEAISGLGHERELSFRRPGS